MESAGVEPAFLLSITATAQLALGALQCQIIGRQKYLTPRNNFKNKARSEVSLAATKLR